jgi:bifunctional DNase/RNase
MKKLKEILQAITFLFVGIPIMIMASIMDQQAFKKGREQRQKAQEQSK